MHYVVAIKGFADYYGIPIEETRRYMAEPIGDILAVRLEQQPGAAD
ncbi:MAG TPA: hypothetical protein VLA19_10525 [Herpetosiphonaceae bacterium]|nr:hypothetical protein [Herpetosiphonaceae bacterium]